MEPFNPASCIPHSDAFLFKHEPPKESPTPSIHTFQVVEPIVQAAAYTKIGKRHRDGQQTIDYKF